MMRWLLTASALLPIACGRAAAEPELGRSAAVDVAIEAGAPVSDGLACFTYMAAVCERYATCRRLPQVAQGCLGLGAGCRDEFLVEGSTRTAENLLSCSEEYADFDCERLLRGQSPACATPGTLPGGAHCQGHMACQSSFCDEDEAGERRCYALAQNGGECPSRTLCPPGQGCEGGRCETIEALSLESGNAPQGATGDPCYETSYCQEGLFCLFSASLDEGTCAEPPQASVPCVSDRPFVADAPRTICDLESYCSEDGMCEALPTIGEPCAVRSDGALPVCRAGSYCEPRSELCEEPRAAGASCRLPTLFSTTSGVPIAPECDAEGGLVCVCPAGSSCEPGFGQCRHGVWPGEPCELETAHCLYGASCLPTGVCDYP